MSWVKSEFSDFLCPPRKKQKTLNTQSSILKQIGNDSAISSEISLKLNLLGKYCPKSKDELVVNKKKIEEVEQWLKNVEQECTYLLITGPPGSGKLQTICVLCKSLKIEVVEWRSPINHTFDPDNYNPFYQNELEAFEDFISGASRYSSVISQSSKRVIVVKDIPNGFLRNNNLFHSLLETYIGIKKMRIIFIISDFSIGRDLFPENIKNNLSVRTINFNPITQRNILSALNVLVKKFDLQKINKNVLMHIDKISEDSNGDLRNAIATLQFFLVKGNFESVPVIVPKKKAKAGKSKMKLDSKIISNTVCDNKIDVFHGLGRVLYAKREEGKLVHDPQEVADSFVTSPQLFINMLHENYPNTFSSIHDVAKASKNLSISDLLLDIRYSCSPILGYGVSVASHGLMTVNSHPIKKFQQFNKSQAKQDNLVKQYKDLLESCNPLWKGLDILMDIAPFTSKISYFESPHQNLFNKLGKLT